MAPLSSEPNAHSDSHQRPMSRIEFCKSVAERARTIAADLISNRDWVMKFTDEAPSQVHYKLESEDPLNPLKGLRTAVEVLINKLRQTQSRSNNDPLLVIVFDEASSLMRETAVDKPRPGL